MTHKHYCVFCRTEISEQRMRKAGRKSIYCTDACKADSSPECSAGRESATMQAFASPRRTPCSGIFFAYIP